MSLLEIAVLGLPLVAHELRSDGERDDYRGDIEFDFKFYANGSLEVRRHG